MVGIPILLLIFLGMFCLFFKHFTKIRRFSYHNLITLQLFNFITLQPYNYITL
nr:MAG TPA: Protein of unknown function (DUF4448) [Caudoviricetes sp.]